MARHTHASTPKSESVRKLKTTTFSERISEEFSEQISEPISEPISKQISEQVFEWISEVISEEFFNRLVEGINKKKKRRGATS